MESFNSIRVTRKNVPIQLVGNPDSKNAIVFFPSARPKNKRRIAPYLPRQSWASEFTDSLCIYIGDPFLDEHGLGNGSWFIDENGKSILPLLAEEIEELTHGKKVLLYGSSMGGYAALIISTHLIADVIAECPQIDLGRFPGSRQVIESLGFTSDSNSSYHVYRYWSDFGLPCGDVRMIFNLGDNRLINQAVSYAKFPDIIAGLKNINKKKFEIIVSSMEGRFGHAHLTKEEAVPLINCWVDSEMQKKSYF